MRSTRAAAAMVLLAVLGLAACGEHRGNDTTVLGGAGPIAGRSGPAAGEALPPPPAPSGTQPQLVLSGEQTALAVWVHDGHVMASTFARPAGWSEARPLEQIHGEASDPQLASNGRGVALAVWRHTVGSIQSLRFSRFDVDGGWSTADVLPGALPRPHAEGAEGEDAAPRLSTDADGGVIARWASGFAAGEVQTARYVPGQGWSRVLSEPVAAAPAAPPPSASR